ncbi:MAG: helix-turn-helix domain-containing protein [Archaeoglobaceae archaeon]|nr:helix-turn-helix domain-containing protein [Archaeoglobaceae archaeon]MDW7989991.1 helix-turn-helix domain-containing protein [Archaeoglobaceae archaeon]
MVYIVVLDMIQSDCPFILSSENVEVGYYMTFWDFKEEFLLNRGYVYASSTEEVEEALKILQKEPNFVDLKVLEREKNRATIKTIINFTEAMKIIRKNGGYIVGPFFIRRGREIWNIGFDDKKSLEITLSELEKNHEFYLMKNNYVSIKDLSSVISNIDWIVNFINLVKNLDPTEKQVLEFAFKLGYFHDPKKANLDDLSSYLNLSKGYISRKLRRTVKKILPEVLSLYNQLKDFH